MGTDVGTYIDRIYTKLTADSATKSTLTLTDDGSNQTLTGSLGDIIIDAAASRVRILGSLRVGVNSAPAVTLDVALSESDVQAAEVGEVARFQNSAQAGYDAYIGVIANDTGIAGIRFGDPTDSAEAQIYYNCSTQDLTITAEDKFIVSATENIQMTTADNFVVEAGIGDYFKFTTQTPATSGSRDVWQLVHKTDGEALATFGGGLGFYNSDRIAALTQVSMIRGRREDAINTGDIAFYGMTVGEAKNIMTISGQYQSVAIGEDIGDNSLGRLSVKSNVASFNKPVLYVLQDKTDSTGPAVYIKQDDVSELGLHSTATIRTDNVFNVAGTDGASLIWVVAVGDMVTTAGGIITGIVFAP